MLQLQPLVGLGKGKQALMNTASVRNLSEQTATVEGKNSASILLTAAP